MTHDFLFSHHEWVRHRLLPRIEGYVAEVSLDDAGVEWVKVARTDKDGALDHVWLRAREIDRFEPVVNGFAPGESK